MTAHRMAPKPTGTHPIFQVPLHETPALEASLGASIVSREQRHAWPLSSVEVLTTDAGRRWVYKAQVAPTVEAEFYQQARSDLLARASVIFQEAGYSALLIEFLDSPTLDDLPLDELALVRHGRALIDEIGRIGGDPPVYVDVSTAALWRRLVATTLELWAGLIDDGRFELTTRGDTEVVAAWSSSPSVLDVIGRTSRLVNGDFKGDAVFLAEGGGYRVVDWQRPYRAPAEVDLVTLLEARQIDPLAHVAPAVFGVRWFLHLHWAIEAKVHLLPHLTLFDMWARDAAQNIARAYEADRASG